MSADADEEKFLQECALMCRCCSRCWQVPCGGCTAGGFCDAADCTCDDEPEYDPEYDDEPEYEDEHEGYW